MIRNILYIEKIQTIGLSSQLKRYVAIALMCLATLTIYRISGHLFGVSRGAVCVIVLGPKHNYLLLKRKGWYSVILKELYIDD